MIIHFYDRNNQSLLASISGDNFINTKITHNIDGFSSCTINEGVSKATNNLSVGGFENIYIEDDNGEIIFGGLLVDLSAQPYSNTYQVIDHRWLFTKILIDEDLTINENSNIEDVIEDLVNDAKIKRNIPILFDKEITAINQDDLIDLTFDNGSDVAGVLKSIIQGMGIRWAVRYKKVDDKIIGELFFRSITGVTPEGVGISRTRIKSEDGDVIDLKYIEGNSKNTINDFSYRLDYSPLNTVTKVGYRDGDQTKIVDVQPQNFIISFYQNLLGVLERFTTDYKIDSEETANIVGGINQLFPSVDFQIVLSPDFNRNLNVGDRVSVTIESERLSGIVDIPMRIDNMVLDRKSGYFERLLTVNNFNPIKQSSLGLLNRLNSLGEELDNLNKSYLNN